MEKDKQTKSKIKKNLRYVISIISPLLIGVFLLFVIKPPLLGILATGALAIVSYLGGGAIELITKESKHIKYGLLSGAIVCVGIIAFEQMLPTKEQKIENFTEGLTQELTTNPTDWITPRKIDVKWAQDFIIIEVMTSGVELDKPIVTSQVTPLSPEEFIDFSPTLEVFWSRDSRATVLTDWAFIFGGESKENLDVFLKDRLVLVAESLYDVPSSRIHLLNAIS